MHGFHSHDASGRVNTFVGMFIHLDETFATIAALCHKVFGFLLKSSSKNTSLHVQKTSWVSKSVLSLVLASHSFVFGNSVISSFSIEASKCFLRIFSL